ncbi:MAG: hypothetical protein IJF80_02360, partial [Clostridia bacterium]|nr:hypothetical protein [Clostridia bacterium]
MKKKLSKQIVATMLLLALLFSMAMPAFAFTSTSYTLTGNQAKDVIGVAESKLGATRSSLGYSADYCAYFVCDVLKIATGASFATKGYPDEAVFAALKSSLKGTYYVFEDKQYNHQDLVNSGLKGTSQVQRVNRSSITPKQGDV